MTTDLLPPARRVLAIVAHPDDEPFGLGGIIAAFVLAGVPVDVLCFTHGEASTLGRQDGRDLGELRTTELAAAGDVLGVERTELLAWPDGGLADRPVVELAVPIAAMARETAADMLLSFDESGVTGHPDHRRASEATRTVANASGMAALAWAVPEAVATQLNGEFGTTFVGYQPHDLSMAVPVDRERQRRAIACHASQAADGIGELEPDTATVFFCNGPQCGQSPLAIRALLDAGHPPELIWYYRGGLHDWMTLGLPTASDSNGTT